MSTTQFPRGAMPSPRHKLACATPHRIRGNAPAEYADVPTRLDDWGNFDYGCCVTTEEAFAKIAAAPNVFLTKQMVIQWAGRHGWLNGAMLTEVMDAMIREGITAEDGKVYKDGAYTSVNWHDRATLCDAIAQGPVKIGVAADQLQQAIRQTGRNGWFGVGFYPDQNTDHCVSLCGYGSMKFLADKLGVSVPQGVDPNGFGYLLFTWSSIGVIDERSMQAITSEAWLRSPTTAGYPTPTPTPAPVPVPPTPPTTVYPKYVVDMSTVSVHLPMFGDCALKGTATLNPVDVARLGAGFIWPTLPNWLTVAKVWAVIALLKQDGPQFAHLAAVVLATIGDVKSGNILAIIAELESAKPDFEKIIADIRAAFSV